MGALTLPKSGLVYLDAMALIYTVESIQPYWSLLEPLWQTAKSRAIEVVSSELTLLESMVGPLKSGNAALEKAYEQALVGTDLRLLPITQPILRKAAQLRATTRLKTPDALHVATAVEAGCALLVTNDIGLRGAGSLPVVVLDDLVRP